METFNCKQLFSQVHINEPEIEVKDESDTEGYASVSPLLRGFGTTVGNAMRRVLLSSIPGSAAVSIVVGGNAPVTHEFSTIDGVREDVCEIVLNVKGIIAKLYSDYPKTAYIDIEGPAEITAGDIKSDSDLVIVNPEHHIATVSSDSCFRMEIKFDNGLGYVSADENKEKYGCGRIGEIFVDSLFSPVVNVGFNVGNIRVGSSLDYDKLEMNIKTNGAMLPTETVFIASEILKEHFELIKSSLNIDVQTNVISKTEESQRQDLLNMPIEELGLTVRSFNCLKRDGVNTVGDLVAKTRFDMAKIRNLGNKSLVEIEESIQNLGLSFKEDEI